MKHHLDSLIYIGFNVETQPFTALFNSYGGESRKKFTDLGQATSFDLFQPVSHFNGVDVFDPKQTKKVNTLNSCYHLGIKKWKLKISFAILYRFPLKIGCSSFSIFVLPTFWADSLPQNSAGSLLPLVADGRADRVALFKEVAALLKL